MDKETFEDGAESILRFFFAPLSGPLDQRDFLRGALVVMLIRKTIMLLGAFAIGSMYGEGQEPGRLFSQLVILPLVAIFCGPYGTLLYNRLQGIGISFRGMGWILTLLLLCYFFIFASEFLFSPMHYLYQCIPLLLLPWPYKPAAGADPGVY